MWVYHEEERRFEDLGKMPEPEKRCRFRAWLEQNIAYIIGGSDVDGKAMTKCLKYDADDQKFEKFGELVHARDNPGVLISDKYLYAFGGNVPTYKFYPIKTIERRLIEKDGEF